jgi:acetyl esterase/lipase
VLTHPLLSPAFADLRALAPLLILAGEHEVLLDDALRVAERARAVGGEAIAHIGRKMQHDWPLTLPWLEESRVAWSAILNFIQALGARAAAAPSSISRHCHLESAS